MNALDPEATIPVADAEIEDLLVDPETGEILADAPALAGAEFGDDEAHHVLRRINRADVEAAVARRTQAAAEARIQEAVDRAVAELMATPDMVEARGVADRAARIAERAERRRDALRDACLVPLANWARRVLGAGRRRTVETPWGSVAFRRTPARFAVREGREDDALAWAARHVPQAVRSRLLLSEIVDRDGASLAALLEPDSPFEMTAPGETVVVRVGGPA